MATKKRTKPRSGPSRSERLAAAARARRRKQNLVRAGVALVAVLVVAGAGFALLAGRSADSRVKAALEAGSCRFDERSDRDSGAGQNHVADPEYDVDPPAGGQHLATAARPGVYTSSQAPPDGEVVHAMEHGYVVFWHRPDLDAAALARLQEVAAVHQRDVLVVARASLEPAFPVAATAWHKRLLCGDVDSEALERFVTEFVNQGPEKVPH